MQRMLWKIYEKAIHFYTLNILSRSFFPSFHVVCSGIIFIGAIYLSVVCTIPELMLPRYGYSFVISGTSLLIVVNVITDTIVAIQTAMLPQKYAKTMRKTYR